MPLKKYEKEYISRKLEIIQGANENLKELSDKMIFVSDSEKYYHQQLTDIFKSVSDLLGFLEK